MLVRFVVIVKSSFVTVQYLVCPTAMLPVQSAEKLPA